MNNKRAGGTRFNIGIASIICIFAVLGLTIFAVLSVSTASAEAKLADKYAASVRDYYAADLACSQLADRFGALWETGASDAELDALALETGAKLTRGDGAVLVAYSVPIDEGQDLAVTLRLGDRFTVERWQTENTGDWQPDDSLNLWNGN